MENLSKVEAIIHIEILIDELQKILSVENLKSYCIKKPERKSLYSEEAARIIQIQGIIGFLKIAMEITEEDLK